MDNKISGDFGVEALEAFRAAYAQREVKPEDLEVDHYTGLPTGEITNISPWIQHTGLWRANPGTEKMFVPNQVLETEEDFEDELSEEDFDRMVEEVISDLEEEEAFANEIYNSDDDDSEEEDDIEDEELEALIDSLLAEDEDEEPEERVGVRRSTDEEPSEEELDAMIQEILAEIDEEELEADRQADNDREMTDEELEDLINELSSDDNDADDADDAGEDAGEVMGEDDIDKLVDEILNGYGDGADGDDETDDYEAEPEVKVGEVTEEESPAWSDEELDEDAFNALMAQVMADDD